MKLSIRSPCHMHEIGAQETGLQASFGLLPGRGVLAVLVHVESVRPFVMNLIGRLPNNFIEAVRGHLGGPVVGMTLPFCIRTGHLPS